MVSLCRLDAFWSRAITNPVNGVKRHIPQRLRAFVDDETPAIGGSLGRFRIKHRHHLVPHALYPRDRTRKCAGARLAS